MRRLARWTLNALTALSLLLCIATVALWFRSRHVEDLIQWYASDNRAYIDVDVSCSELSVTYYQLVGEAGAVFARDLAGHNAFLPPRPIHRYPLETVRHSAHLWGFSWESGTEQFGDVRTSCLILPLWIAAVACAALPVVALTRAFARGVARRSERRAAAGLCPGCGYDLRATPEKCPECGRVVAAVS